MELLRQAHGAPKSILAFETAFDPQESAKELRIGSQPKRCSRRNFPQIR